MKALAAFVRFAVSLSLLGCGLTGLAQVALFSDDFSDPKLTGWTTLGSAGLRTNINQQLVISANCGPFQTNDLFATHFVFGHEIGTSVTLTNNWTVEGRADLVSVNQNDAWASMHFLWNTRGGSGYIFWKDEDEVALMKFWDGGGSMACFFYEERRLKNTNVTLVLTLTRRDSDLVVNSRVLDKGNANGTLFDRTVIDTPQADPVLPNRAVRGVPSVQDLAGEAWRLISGPGYVEATLDWVNSEDGPSGPAEVVYDNVEVRLYESPRPNVAAPGSWTRKANMPLALDTHASCEVDGILYVIGGHKDLGVYTQLPTVFAYDPMTDSWTRKADMPTSRRFVAACAEGGIIYAIGGGGLINTPPMDVVEAYDPQTDTWATKAKLSSPRFSLSACAVGGIIYAIGGAIGATSTGFQGLTKVEAYDPKTDQWMPKANLPTPVLWGAASVVDGIIYVFSRKETFAYDPKTDRWTRKASIPAWSLYSLFSTCSVVDGIVYLFGGAASDGQTTYDLALAYDPIQNKFTAKRKLPMPCEAAACATIDGKIYHTGGANQDPFVRPVGAAYYDSLWVFDPQGGVAPQLLGLNHQSADMVRLTWQGEVGRLYGLQTTSEPVKGPWARTLFSTGGTNVLATNTVVEATCSVPSADSKRFFRVFEAN